VIHRMLRAARRAVPRGPLAVRLRGLPRVLAATARQLENECAAGFPGTALIWPPTYGRLIDIAHTKGVL